MLNSLVSTLCRPENSPLRFHTELSLNDLDEVPAILPLVTFLEQEDFLICASKQDLVEDVLVGANTRASTMEQMQVTSEWTKRLEDEDVFEPEISVPCRRQSPLTTRKALSPMSFSTTFQ